MQSRITELFENANANFALLKTLAAAREVADGRHLFTADQWGPGLSMIIERLHDEMRALFDTANTAFSMLDTERSKDRLMIEPHAARIRELEKALAAVERTAKRKHALRPQRKRTKRQ
jgi:hypothetical protein